MESHRTREPSKTVMKKNKTSVTSKKYVDGGQVFDTIGSLAPLLNMIPGIGQAAAPLVGLGASFLGNKSRQANQNNNGSNPTGYTNSNAFGYADGGPVDPKFKGVNMARENTATRPIGNNSTEAKLRALVSYHNTNAPTNENAKLADYYQSQLTNLNQNSQAYQKRLVSPEKIGSVIGNTALDLMPGKLGKALNFAKTAQGRPNELIPFNNILQYIGELGGGNSSFKFAEGGSLQSLNSTSQVVTGAPNEIDGNQINYKGTNINLNHGETLDTNRDRVISDKYINPETGKRIIDEDKRLKSLRGKAEKIYQTTNDLAAKNTIKRTQEMEDNLYSIQENEAMKQGDRNSDGSTVQQGRRYKDGGDIQLQPQDRNAELIAQMQQLIQQINKPQHLEQPNRMSKNDPMFGTDVTWSQGGPQSETAANYPAFAPSATPGISSTTATNNSKSTEYIPSNGKVSTMADKPAIKGRAANLELQRKLVELGYSNIGKAGIKNDIDGVIGNRTNTAIRQAVAAGKLDESYLKYISTSGSKGKAKEAPKVKEAETAKTKSLEKDLPSASIGRTWGNPTIPQATQTEYQSEPFGQKYNSYEQGLGSYNEGILAEAIRQETPKRIDKKKLESNDRMLAKRHVKEALKANYQPQGNYNLDPIRQRMVKGLFATGGSLKSYDQGGPLLSNQNPDNLFAQQQYPMYLNQLGNLGMAQASITPAAQSGITSSIERGPMDPNGNYLGSNYGADSVPRTKGFGEQAMQSWKDMTPGEKVGLGTSALSVALKATDAFGKVQKEPYRYNNAAISLNQLDPTAILNNNQQSYQSALNDLNNNSSTGSNRAAIAANLFNNKLRANNDVMTKYGEQNSNLATQYEQRLAQRNSENNNMAYQVDDLNSKNRGAAQQMRSGVYADLSTLGLNQANVLNNKMSQKATLEALKKMAPDVYEGLMKNIKLQ